MCHQSFEMGIFCRASVAVMSIVASWVTAARMLQGNALELKTTYRRIFILLTTGAGQNSRWPDLCTPAALFDIYHEEVQLGSSWIIILSNAAQRKRHTVGNVKQISSIRPSATSCLSVTHRPVYSLPIAFVQLAMASTLKTPSPSITASLSVTDQWLVLNHTKEKLQENVTGAYEWYKLCSVEWTDFPSNDCIVSIVRNRCYNRYNNPYYDKDKENWCSLLMNPVFTRSRENEIITVKNQHCFSNSSMPWQCYNEGTVPTFPSPPTADWSNAIEFWMDRNGKWRVKYFTTDKATRENRGNCFSSKPFLLILPLTVMEMNILARIYPRFVYSRQNDLHRTVTTGCHMTNTYWIRQLLH